jgi:serine phosphatase RsbU (regulator of sigma subunit)/PAS domain-containing protein
VKEKAVNQENYTYQDYINLQNAFLEKQKLMEEQMWIDSSVATFNEELQKNYGKSTEDFAKSVLSYLAKLTNAFKGYFYVADDTNIKSVATYGAKAKVILQLGEGTVGQAIESREVLFFENITPKSIVLDSKGGTVISASAMIVLPLIFGQKVYGALELLFVNALPKKYYEFLTRTTTNVAATLESIINYFNTKSLLEESIKTSQILQAAEEELRQNFEELEATQQQMLVVHQQLEQKNFLIDALLQSSRDGILILDREHRVLLFNRSSLKMLNIDERCVVVGQKIGDYSFIKVSDIEKTFSGETVLFEHQSNDQSMNFYAVTLYPIQSDEEIIGCGMMLKDITIDRMRENTLVMQNKKMQANEAVLKKAFEKMKKTQEELQEAHRAQKVVEEELRQSSEELAAQRDAISSTLSKLEIQSGRISDSIRYAERMQKGILPSHETFAKYFKDHFIIFEPKDVVSGDFYWFLQHENYTFVAVADCTGHGVPGAFMSMIGNTLLNEIVFGSNIVHTDGILYALNMRIRAALNQDSSEGDDGLDIAVCRLKRSGKKNYEVAYSGAKLNLYCQKGNVIDVIKADRVSLGGRRSPEGHHFAAHNFQLSQGDRIFLMTDGMSDLANQARKRFGSKRILEVFEENKDLKITEVGEMLKLKASTFLGRGEQRDDVTVIGLELA